MSALDRPPTLRDTAFALGVVAAATAAGYGAGIWHSSNFASRAALEQLEHRVSKIERATK